MWEAQTADGEGLGFAWKIHLNVSRNMEDPETKVIIAYCEAAKKDYKIYGYKVGQAHDDKGMTIYVGDRASLEKIAADLNELKTTDGKPAISKPAGQKVVDGDMPVKGNVWARFTFNKGERTVGGKKFHRSGMHGLPNILELTDTKENLLASYTILAKEYGEYFTGVPERQTPEWAKWLHDPNAKEPEWMNKARKEVPTTPLPDSLPDWLKSPDGIEALEIFRRYKGDEVNKVGPAKPTPRGPDGPSTSPPPPGG